MERIGVIGIGFIGRRLVEALVDADYEVYGYDVNAACESVLEKRGGTWKDSPTAVAEQVDAVVLAVPGGPEVTGLLEGPDGICATLATDGIIIDTTTTGPAVATAAAEWCHDHNHAFVTAPLTRAAPVGGIHMMVGADDEDYEIARPLIEVLSRNHVRIGSPAEAQTFKLILQVRYASQTAVDAEIVAFARDCGLDPAIYREFLELDIDEGYLDRDFTQSISGLGGLAIWHKDIGYALEVARDRGTATPITNAVFEAYKFGMGFKEQHEDVGDATTILRYWETLNDT